MDKELIQKQVNKLYNNYKNKGGIRIYNIDRLCTRSIVIKDLIYQEEAIKEMYFIIHNIKISKKTLETMYLGRKCVNPYQKYNTKLKYGIPLECINYGEDPFTTFTNKYRIEGFTNRMYWKEKNIELIKNHTIKKIKTIIFPKCISIKIN